MKINITRLTLFFLIFFILTSCDFDLIDNDYINEDKVVLDGDNTYSSFFHGNRQGVDAFTSATPGVDSKVLEVRHAGWQQAECFSCHGYMHGSQKPTGCINCHGRNGALAVKPRGTLHSLDRKDCSKCHKYVHLESSFTAPFDCFQCHRFEKKNSPDYNDCTVEYESDVVVIGAGGGGLSAAATLAKSGKKVVVLEQHHKVGGYMTNFKRGDYTFEVSLHAYDSLNPNGITNELFTKLGLWDKVKPVKEEILYRILYPDFDFEVPQGYENYKQVLYETFPHEKRALDMFFEDLDRFDDIYKKIVQTTIDPDSNKINAKDIGTMFYYSNQKLTTYLDKVLKIQDQKLKSTLVILSPFLGTKIGEQCTWLFLMMWKSLHQYGYYYFEGGSQAVSYALAEVIQENGGVIHLNTKAKKIEIEKGKATMVKADNNVCYKADYVISNASAPATMYELIGEDKISKYDKNRFKKWKKGYSMFVVHLGVDHDYSDVFNGSAELMSTSTYDFDEGFEKSISCSEDSDIAINNYTMLDPTNVDVEGKNVITLSRMADYKCFDEWKWDEGFQNYKELKNRIARNMLLKAEEMLPGLREHIEYMEIVTPRTLSHFTLNPVGTVFGWDHQMSQVMFNRMNNDKYDGIDNVYQVGAWGSPGGGQSTVMVGGYTVAQKIIKKENGDGTMDSFMRFIYKVIGLLTGIFY